MIKTILITGLIIVAVFNYGQTLQKDTLAKETGVTNELPRGRAPKYQMEFIISDPEGQGIEPLYE